MWSTLSSTSVGTLFRHGVHLPGLGSSCCTLPSTFARSTSGRHEEARNRMTLTPQQLGQKLDRHHPADSHCTLSSCSKCGFLVTLLGTQEHHLPTDTSLPDVTRLLGFYDW